MSQQTYEINIFEIWLFYFNLFWNSPLNKYDSKDWNTKPKHKDFFVGGGNNEKTDPR